MRKTSIAENWSAVEELRMVISRVGEERRTLEAQLGKVKPSWITSTMFLKQQTSLILDCGMEPLLRKTLKYIKIPLEIFEKLNSTTPQLMEDRSAMARSVEEQGLRMVHLEKEGRQLEREVWKRMVTMMMTTIAIESLRLVLGYIGISVSYLIVEQIYP